MAIKEIKAGVKITGTDQSVGAFRSLSSSLSQSNEAFSKFKNTYAGLGNIASGIGKAGGIIGGVVGGIGAAVVGAGIGVIRFAQSVNEEIDGLADMSAKIGITAQELDRLNYVAKLSGVEPEQAQAAWQKFALKMADFRDKSSGAYKELRKLNSGLASNLPKTKDNTEALTASLDALAKMRQGFKQDQAAQALFGKGALSVLAILQQGPEAYQRLRAEAEKYGLVNEDMVEKSGRFGDSSDRLARSLRGLKMALGAELMPALADAAQGMADFFAENRADILKGASGLIKNLGDLLKNSVQYLVEHPDALRDFFQGAASAINSVVRELKDVDTFIKDVKGFGGTGPDRRELALKRADAEIVPMRGAVTGTSKGIVGAVQAFRGGFGDVYQEAGSLAAAGPGIPYYFGEALIQGIKSAIKSQTVEVKIEAPRGYGIQATSSGGVQVQQSTGYFNPGALE